MISEGGTCGTHDVMYLCASWNAAVAGAVAVDDASLASDTESSTTARAPSPVVGGAAMPAPLFPAELIRDVRASGGDDGVTPGRPVEEAEEAEPGEEPRGTLFVRLLRFFLGAAGGAVVGACCPRGCCCCEVDGGVVASCPEPRFAFFVVAVVVMTLFMGARLGVVGDDAAGGSALPRACGAGVSESVAISSAIVLAVGEVAAGVAVARGTSTKSAVSERGEWRGGEVERRAEEERDQTISSSSEGESLAHRVLEVSESTSSEDESEVVMDWSAGLGEREKTIYLVQITKGRGRKGGQRC